MKKQSTLFLYFLVCSAYAFACSVPVPKYFKLYNLTPIQSGNRCQLTWTNPGMTDGFILERSEDDSNWSFLDTVSTAGGTSISYSDIGLLPCTNYYYRVCSFTEECNSPFIKCDPFMSVLGVIPIFVTVDFAMGPKLTINLGWNYEFNFVTSFLLERSINGSAFIAIDETPSHIRSHTDTGLSYCNTYNYRIRAFYNNCYSNIGSTGFLEKKPAIPSYLHSTPQIGGIDLDWGFNTSFEKGIQIEKNENYMDWFVLDTVAISTHSYLDTMVQPGHKYSYRARSFESSSCISEYSNQANQFLPVQGHSARLVLMEEFTGEDCPPSASFNPAFDSVLNANMHKVVAIKYFLPYNWGNSSVKPFYFNNPEEYSWRNQFYRCYAIPQGYLNGLLNFAGSGSSLARIQNDIDSASTLLSPFIINAEHSITDSIISLKVIIRATSDVSAVLKMRIAVIERRLTFDTPPGTNGEKQFECMMKKMIPNADGILLSNNYRMGDSTVLEYSWKLANHIYDMNQLAVVAFIQDDSSKYIYQAGYSPPLFETGLFSKVAGQPGLFSFPNPSNGRFVFANSDTRIQTGLITIYNTLGELVFRKSTATGSEEIDLTDKKTGTYFLHYSNETGTSVTKLMINQQ